VRWTLDFLGAWGDDASLIVEENIIVNVDAFDGQLHWYPFLSPIDAGWRAMLGACSDVAVKGGKPMWALVAVRIPRWYMGDVYRDFLRGASGFCREMGCKIIGGDTDVAEGDGFRASVFVAGPARRYVGRRGARPGDFVLSTGAFGIGAVLYRGYKGGCYAKAVRAFRRPRLPDLEPWLRVLSTATSSIDNSDGLAVSLHLLAEASNVGIVVEDVPLHPLLVECGGDAEDALYFSGEEYQFIYTVPREEVDEALSAMGGFVIGRVVDGKGVRLYSGERVERRGWIGGEGYSGSRGDP